MLINPNPTPETLALSLQQKRAEGSAQAATSTPTDSAASQVDPSLQRLTDIPTGIQGDWEIQDGAGAGDAVESLRQAMLSQPNRAMAAQGNQLSQNVLNLLQPAD